MRKSVSDVQHIGAFVLVLSPDKYKVLIGKRRNAYKPGFWGFPGGRLNLNESVEKCAKRELFEETRIIAEKISYIGIIRENQKTYDFIHFIFVCTSFLGNVILAEPDKCEGWEWKPIEEMPKNTLSSHKIGLQMYRNNESFSDIWQGSV